jgi:hypothetical protein
MTNVNTIEADARRLVRIDRINQAGITLIALLVYGMTMCRTIYSGDDGDFITAMATLGNSHPTGYPIFILLGHLFLKLLAPVLPDPASRINALTVLCGSVAIGLFYRFLTTLKLERYICWTATLFLAFSPTLWQQSLSCEVYALTAAYLCAILWTALSWWQQPNNDRMLRGLALLYGFACTNNMMIVLLFPGFLVFVLSRRLTLIGKEWRVLLSLVPLFVAPLLFYIYLPWSAHRHTPVNWGDPSDWPNFYAKISGAQYRELMFHSMAAFQRNCAGYFGSWEKGQFVPGYLWKEFTPYFLWLLPFGGVALWKRVPRPFFWLMMYIIAVNLTFSLNYNIFDVYVYFIPGYVIMTALIGLATSQMISWVMDRCKLSSEQRDHYQNLIAVVCAVLPLVYMSLHYAETDESGNTQEADFAYNIMQSCPPNTVIIDSSEAVFTLWYRKFVLHERPDVVLINRNLLQGVFEQNAWYYKHIQAQYPDIVNTYPHRRGTRAEGFNNDFLFALMKRAVDRGLPVLWVADTREDSKPAFIVGKETMEERLGKVFDRHPWGVVERLYKKGTVVTNEELFAGNKPAWDKFQFHKLSAWAHADPDMEYIPLRYGEAFMAWGHLAEQMGDKTDAITAYKNALSLYEVPEAHAGLKRMGVTP